MSVSRSVSNSLSRSTSRSLGLARGSSGGSAFSPLSLSGLRQYALDGGESYHDSTVGGYPVLRSLEPYGTHRQPRQGRCWLFDGVNDRGTHSSIPLGTTHTTSAWVRPSLAASFGFNALNGNGLTAGASANLCSLGIIDNGTAITQLTYSYLAAGVSVSIVNILNTWSHIATVRIGDTIEFYLNGVSVGSGVGSGIVSFNQNTIGARHIDPRYKGNLRDYRVFSTAKTASEILAIYNGEDDATGLLAQYPCNEESGTTGYDISGNGNHLTLTNITQSTFHAADTGVTSNRNNEDGYRLSGSVYIPKRLSDANAADGNALTVTGQSPYPINVEVPCVTGNGSTVYGDLGSPLIPATADFELSANIKFASGGNVLAIDQRVGANIVYIAQAGSLTRIRFPGIDIYAAVTVSAWNKILVTRQGSSFSVYVNGVLLGAGTSASSIPQISTVLLANADTKLENSNLSIADLRITTGGVTTYFPLQDGPGSSNTNRNLSYIKSDGTYGVISDAIVNGTVATIWANRCPYAEDWSVNYGGDIAANGAFLPGQISGSLSADGTAKTLEAGKFGNPYSRANFNPFTAAELNGLGTETAYAVGTARQSVSPTDTKFRRTAAAGDDRLITTSTALTGTDKTNTEGYVA